MTVTVNAPATTGTRVNKSNSTRYPSRKRSLIMDYPEAMMNHRDDAPHLLHIREIEVAALRDELTRAEVLIGELRRDLVKARLELLAAHGGVVVVDPPDSQSWHDS
jgi:hypothetical protein